MARQWSARCYGVARHREGGRAKTAGSPACFLSGISGGIPLSLGAWVPKNLARRNFGLLVSAGRCGSPRPRPPRRAPPVRRPEDAAPPGPPPPSLLLFFPPPLHPHPPP